MSARITVRTKLTVRPTIIRRYPRRQRKNVILTKRQKKKMKEKRRILPKIVSTDTNNAGLPDRSSPVVTQYTKRVTDRGEEDGNSSNGGGHLPRCASQWKMVVFEKTKKRSRFSQYLLLGNSDDGVLKNEEWIKKKKKKPVSQRKTLSRKTRDHLSAITTAAVLWT